jgi:hypothetical protein
VLQIVKRQPDPYTRAAGDCRFKKLAAREHCLNRLRSRTFQKIAMLFNSSLDDTIVNFKKVEKIFLKFTVVGNGVAAQKEALRDVL